MPTLTTTPDEAARLARLIAGKVLAGHGEWTASIPALMGLTAARLPGHSASAGFGHALRAMRAAQPLLADYGISCRAVRPHGQPPRWRFELTHLPTDRPAA